jgi:hypothetical protein
MLVSIGFTSAGSLMFEGHARHQQPVEEAFQHGGQAEAPGGEAQDDGVGAVQAFDVAGQGCAVLRDVVVVQAFFPRHHRVEVLGVEVAVVDRVAGRAEVLQHLLVERRGEAGFDRMAVDDEDMHWCVSFSAAHRNGAVQRVVGGKTVQVLTKQSD